MGKYKKLFIFAIISLIALIMCSGYVSGHYSIDDYNIMNIGYNNYSIHNNLKDGRLIMFIIDQIYNKFNISYNCFIISTVFIAIVLTSLNIILLFNLIEKYYKDNNKTILYIILFSTIFNFMYIENLYFVESIVMSLALVLYTLSAKCFFQDKKYSNLKALLLNILALFCYNGLECYFIVIVSFISLLNNKEINKKVLSDILKAGFMIMISVILNFIQIIITCKILNVDLIRLNSSNSIIYNIAVIFSRIPNILKNTSYLLPNYMFIFIILFLLILSIVYDYKRKNTSLFINNFFLFVICVLSCFCISIISLSSFGSGRLLYGIGMGIGIILLNILIKIGNKNLLFKRVIIILIIIWTSFNIMNYYCKTNMSKEINKSDKIEVSKLDDYLKEYETDNGVKIEKIVCILDRDGKKTNLINYSALESYWSSDGIIKFYTGRELKKEAITLQEMDNYLSLMKNKKYLIDNNKLILKIYDW